MLCEKLTDSDRGLLEQLAAFSVPELCDGAEVFRAMDYHIKPWTGRTRIIGRALTVSVPAGEGAIVTEAIEAAGEGDVIVIAGQGVCSCAYWGDHRSYCARFQKAAGVVIDGAFRDTVQHCTSLAAISTRYPRQVHACKASRRARYAVALQTHT